MEEPFVPFTKPYGMSDEQFEDEVREAQNLHDLWLYQLSFKPLQSEEEIRIEEDLWYDMIYKEQIENNSSNEIHFNYDGFCVGFTKF